MRLGPWTNPLDFWTDLQYLDLDPGSVFPLVIIIIIIIIILFAQKQYGMSIE